MADFPALPLFTDAYLSDTHPGLTLEEHGAYLLLMMLAWRRPGCALPNSEAAIKAWLGVHGNKWNHLRRRVLERFWQQRANGEWVQKRLTKERVYCEQKSARNSANAKSRWDRSSKIDRKSNQNGKRFAEDSTFSSKVNSTPDLFENNNMPDATAIRSHQSGNAPTPTPTVEVGESLFPTERKVGANTRDGDVSRGANEVNGASHDDPKKTLFDLGTTVLGRGNGSLVGKLLKAKNGNIDRAIATLCDAQTTANPKGYVATVIRNAEIQGDDEYLDPHRYMRL